MRRAVLILLSIAVLAACNLAIYRNERLLAVGETIYLELAPVDPRSLMQGDYMRLRYAIERKAEADPGGKTAQGGYMVVSLDEKRVASFVRFHEGGAISPNERLVPYHREIHSLRVVPDSFMFQEGQAAVYSGAKFGEFKTDGAGRQLLVGLAGPERERLGPERKDMAAPRP
jgi:uncharacterized membrane-anchored protein